MNSSTTKKKARFFPTSQFQRVGFFFHIASADSMTLYWCYNLVLCYIRMVNTSTQIHTHTYARLRYRRAYCNMRDGKKIQRLRKKCAHRIFFGIQACCCCYSSRMPAFFIAQKERAARYSFLVAIASSPIVQQCTNTTFAYAVW